MRLLDSLARQAADLIERARAEEAVAADLRDTRMLRDLGARLVSEGDIQSLYLEDENWRVECVEFGSEALRVLTDRLTSTLSILTLKSNRL